MWRSVRTKFGLVTGAILLILLFVFYLGGRFILVHMIREAEKEIEVVGSDIKTIVYGELAQLQQTTLRTADILSRSGAAPTQDFLQNLLRPCSGQMPVNLAVALSADGVFLNGCFLASGAALQTVGAEQMQPYIDASSPLLASVTHGKNVSGLIAFENKPLFIALTPVTAPSGKVTAFLVVGSLLHNNPLLSRISEATHGMQVAVSDRRVVKGTAKPANPAIGAAVAPVFPEALNYYSGGMWHLGENSFEVVLPVHDILGKEVSSISIRLPRTFSSLASIALGWLTVFVASVGIVFVLPIFWLQTRLVLNPLSLLANQIRNIGEHHLDGNCTYLQWPRKDEFGLVAQSVNGLLDALSHKTQQIYQIEQRQRALITGMPDCLCIFDTTGHLVAIHKQPDYVHPIPGLIVGHPIAPPIFAESDCEALRKAITETFRSDKIQVVLISCKEKDGAYRRFETRISLMDSYFALVILRDVTKEWCERESRQQMENRFAKIQKMESLGNLAASIAHDFNNMLAIIQNTVELTWAQPLTNKEEDVAVSTIRQATAKGAALTRELMTYAGQTQISFKRDDPNALLLELEKLMGGVIASNISLELKLTPGLPKVDADPHQFWKVIINLLKNASEAMNGSRGCISISTYSFEMTQANKDRFFSTQELNPGPGVVFQIADTGSGIPQEMIGRLFEPFFSTKAVGRGLGLATVFGIVDAHNGGIAIDSIPGKGATFRVWLPSVKECGDSQETVAAQALPATVPVADTQPRPATATPRPCVLMVEDDLAIRQTTQILLRSLGANTLTAGSRREALALFKKHTDAINLILLDAQIDSLDNVRLLATLRARKPGIPTIIVSGHIETRIREVFASEPFNGFLSKPYTTEDLWRALSPFITLKKTSSAPPPRA